MIGMFQQGDYLRDQNATPEALKRKRERIAALMPQYGKAKYVGEGLGQLFYGIGSGLSENKLDKYEGEKRSEATAALGSAFGGGPLSILGMQQDAPQPAPSPNPDQAIADDTMAALGKSPIRPAGGALPQGNEMADYITQAASARGIDPNVALAVARAEGLNADPNEAWQSRVVKNGKRERSYGPFQLFIDGGLGNDFMDSTGLDPRDATTWQQQVDFALDHASKNGWGAWYGARDTGIGNMQGIGGAPSGGSSFAPGGGTQMAQNQPRGTPMQDVDPNLMQMLQNPWLTPQQRETVKMQIDQQQRQREAILSQTLKQQDPMYQVQLQQAQLDLQNARQGITTDAKVQSSVVLDDGTSVLIMNDGARRVLSPTGEEVQGDAAAEAIMAARNFTTENQQDIYNARRSGTLGADIELGGVAEATKDVAKATVEAGVSAWNDYGKLQSSIGTIDEAIAAIDSGAESGMVYKYLPDVTLASASLTNAMDRMGLDVIGSVTFGALSEAEMRLAMNTAVPRDLSPPELREWLVKKKDAQQKAAVMLADAAQFLTRPGNTINDWIEKNRKSSASTGATTQDAPGIQLGTQPQDDTQTQAANPYVGMSEEEFADIDLSTLTPEQLDQLFEARSQ